VEEATRRRRYDMTEVGAEYEYIYIYMHMDWHGLASQWNSNWQVYTIL
jgi:hypothetical protein